MDALNHIADQGSEIHSAIHPAHEHARQDGVAWLFPATPPEAPLAMPVQDLRRFNRSQGRSFIDSRSPLWVWLARLVIFRGGRALTA